MTATKTQAVYQAQTYNYKKVVKSTEQSKEQFNTKSNNYTDPKSISYEQYKSMNPENIEELYPQETMPKEYKEALSLNIKANMTDDEVLNKVLFDKELESLNSTDKEYLKPANQMLNNIFDAYTTIAHNTMRFEAAAKHFESFAIDKGSVMKEYEFEFAKTVQITVGEVTKSVSYNHHVSYSSKSNLTTSSLFTAFDTMAEQFKMIKDEHIYDEDSHFYRGTRAIISYHDSIKKEYKDQTQEKETLLSEVTKNTKPNPLENIQQNKANEKPKFIDTLDKLNPKAFEDMGISKEDEKLFRTIIDDGKINEQELIDLSFEQTEQLNQFYHANLSYVIDEVGKENTPILLPTSEALPLLQSSQFTPNETFNKAFHQTLIESTHLNKHELEEMISQLQSNLLQKHLDMEFTLTNNNNNINSVGSPYFLEKENFDFDYDKFVSNISTYYNKEATKDHKFDDIKENYIQRAEWFSIFEKNYNIINN